MVSEVSFKKRWVYENVDDRKMAMCLQLLKLEGMGRGTWVYSFYLKISLKISMIRSLKYLDY